MSRTTPERVPQMQLAAPPFSLLLILSRQQQWRHTLTPLSCPATMTSGTPLTRHCHWRFKLPASVNGGTHVKNKSPLQFLINETPFSKLFIKEPLHSKFASLSLCRVMYVSVAGVRIHFQIPFQITICKPYFAILNPTCSFSFSRILLLNVIK